MTAIVAHRSGWMVADLACTAGTWAIPVAESKIIRFGSHSLAAAAGLSGFNYETREIQEHHARYQGQTNATPEHLIDSLCELQKAWTEKRAADDCRLILVVTNDGQLITVNAAGIPERLHSSVEYWSIGSGDEWCLGFLAGLINKHPEIGGIAPHDAVEAIRSASVNNLGVSYATTTEHL